MGIRIFTGQLNEENPLNRHVDNDAPVGLRHEFIDLAFNIFERAGDFDERRLHHIIVQSLGGFPSGQPYGGARRECSREIARVDWPRVYDLICRLWNELLPGSQEEYRAAVNRLLVGHQIVWDLGVDGRLHRAVPAAVAAQIETTFRELNQPRFTSALDSFREGFNAYDDRPQRGRDACKNVFDALESVGKVIYNIPRGTFGDVIAEARRSQQLTNETINVLQRLYDMSNNHFRHGLVAPFGLSRAEVDFVIIACMAGILLLIRV